jgi:hypothetical protein
MADLAGLFVIAKANLAKQHFRRRTAVANLDPEVWAAVESAIRRNPTATLDELLALAAGVSPGIEKLDRRQFNARYPLQIKRKLGIKGGGGGGTGRATPATKARRKVGRPKKVGAAAKKSTGKRPGRPRKNAVTPAATGAKRRGRPRKNPVAATGAKRRGRPPKNALAAPAQTGAKRRGRPPKNAVTAPAATGAKRRGRPPKNPSAVPAQAGAKRRGRPPKNLAAVPAQTGGKRRGRPPGSGKKAVGRPRAASTGGGNRDSIRNTLMGFAQDILSAAAEAPKKLVQVIAGIDHYVDRISKS